MMKRIPGISGTKRGAGGRKGKKAKKGGGRVTAPKSHAAARSSSPSPCRACSDPVADEQHCQSPSRSKDVSRGRQAPPDAGWEEEAADVPRRRRRLPLAPQRPFHRDHRHLRPASGPVGDPDRQRQGRATGSARARSRPTPCGACSRSPRSNQLRATLQPTRPRPVMSDDVGPDLDGPTPDDDDDATGDDETWATRARRPLRPTCWS